MKQPWFVVVMGMLMLSACGEKTEVAPVSTAPPAPPAVEQKSMEAPPAGGAMMAPASAVEAAATAAAAAAPAAMEKLATTAEKAVEGVKGAMLGEKDALALAEKSGCLACHKIDAKSVGPAWRDVSKRYKGAADAKATLIASVKMGSKGKWIDVTGGIPMPPNSPRVSDENTEKLVTFILSL